MENDLNSLISSVMSDPEQMEKIAALAKNLMGGGSGSGEERPKESAATEVSGGQNIGGPGPGGLTGLLDQLLSRGGKETRSTKLLLAMRPYMKPEKQEKLDRAMKLARLVSIAGTVMKQYGGEGFGL